MIPRMAAMDEAERELARALVAGTRPNVGVPQILLHLARHYQVTDEEVRICRYRLGGFLLRFIDGAGGLCVVLQTVVPASGSLVFPSLLQGLGLYRERSGARLVAGDGLDGGRLVLPSVRDGA